MGKVWKMPAPPKLVIKPPTVDIKSGGMGSDVFFEVTGSKSLQETLRQLSGVARDAAGMELAQIGHEVILSAKETYVPERFGRLRDSGDSDEYNPLSGVDITTIAIWFGAPPSGLGGGAAISSAVAAQAGLSEEADPSVYALAQHETLYQNYTKAGTGPKYLETPFMLAQPTVGPRIARAVAEAWGMNEHFVAFALL